MGEFEFTSPGSLTSTFLGKSLVKHCFSIMCTTNRPLWERNHGIPPPIRQKSTFLEDKQDLLHATQQASHNSPFRFVLLFQNYSVQRHFRNRHPERVLGRNTCAERASERCLRRCGHFGGPVLLFSATLTDLYHTPSVGMWHPPLKPKPKTRN